MKSLDGCHIYPVLTDYLLLLLLRLLLLISPEYPDGITLAIGIQQDSQQSPRDLCVLDWNVSSKLHGVSQMINPG